MGVVHDGLRLRSSSAESAGRSRRWQSPFRLLTLGDSKNRMPARRSAPSATVLPCRPRARRGAAGAVAGLFRLPRAHWVPHRRAVAGRAAADGRRARPVRWLLPAHGNRLGRPRLSRHYADPGRGAADRRGPDHLGRRPHHARMKGGRSSTLRLRRNDVARGPAGHTRRRPAGPAPVCRHHRAGRSEPGRSSRPRGGARRSHRDRRASEQRRRS